MIQGRTPSSPRKDDSKTRTNESHRNPIDEINAFLCS